jgi:hypothetical protein
MKNNLESPGRRVRNVHWIDMAQDRIDACNYGDNPQSFIKCGELIDYYVKLLDSQEKIVFFFYWG